MKDRTLKILLVLNLVVLTGIFLGQALPVPSADAQTSSVTMDNPELTGFKYRRASSMYRRVSH